MMQASDQDHSSPPGAVAPDPAPGTRTGLLERATDGGEGVVEMARAALERIEGRSDLAAMALVGLLASELAFVLLATAHPWGLAANGSFAFRSGVAWPFARLASALPYSHAFIKIAAVVLLGVMTACYLLLLAVRDVRARWALLALAVAYSLVVLSPQLISKDAYLYLAYSRLDAVHHLNPYVTPPIAIKGALLRYVAWKHQLSPYGALFTLSTYPLGLTSLAGGLWILKLMTVAAALGCLGLVWKCAQLLNLRAAYAALAVGLNPLFLIYGVGGSHNDLLMMLLVMAGVYLALSARQRMAGVAAVAAIGVKIAAAPIAPFLLLISRERPQRRRAVLAAAAAAVGLLGLSLLIFGPHILGVTQQANTVGQYSVPRLLTLPLGIRSTNACDRHAAMCHARLLTIVPTVILGLVVLLLLVWVLRGGDAITASGWAAFTLVVTLTAVQPWYFVWVLPLAVLSPSRKLHFAAGCLAGFLLLTAWPISNIVLSPFIHTFHRLH